MWGGDHYLDPFSLVIAQYMLRLPILFGAIKSRDFMCPFYMQDIGSASL